MNTTQLTPATDSSADTTPPATTPQSFKDFLPWDGKPSRGDKALIGLMFGVPAFYLATMPFRPFLIAEAPVLLELVVGSKAAVAAAAAYASIGQLPLWLVIMAGVLGMAKFDWMFWLGGRRWGERVLRTFASTPAQQKWVNRVQRLPRWALALLVAASRLPGIPGPIVWLLAGMNGMRLRTFLVLDLIAAGLVTGIVTTAGYLSGEAGVAVVQTIDTYALWIGLGIVMVMSIVAQMRAKRRTAA